MNNYQPHEAALANEIANTLQDRDALPLYLKYAKQYQEAYLRRILSKVMNIEERKIRKTRGALFTFLVSQNEANSHIGD
jgi:hypothetical protein